jgi:hypothetical protein
MRRPATTATREGSPPIDMRTGELGLAASLHGWQLSDLTHHPTSGAPIADVTLSHGNVLRELVLRAQLSIPGRKLIGWGIAITAEGPIIVEGNGATGLELIQRTHGPLGRSRLGPACPACREPCSPRGCCLGWRRASCRGGLTRRVRQHRRHLGVTARVGDVAVLPG